MKASTELTINEVLIELQRQLDLYDTKYLNAPNASMDAALYTAAYNRIDDIKQWMYQRLNGTLEAGHVEQSVCIFPQCISVKCPCIHSVRGNEFTLEFILDYIKPDNLNLPELPVKLNIAQLRKIRESFVVEDGVPRLFLMIEERKDDE